MPPGQGDMGCTVTGNRRGGSEEGRPASHQPELTPRLGYGMPQSRVPRGGVSNALV